MADRRSGEQPALRTLAAVFACFGFFWGAWAVAASDIKHSLNLSDGNFGLLLSVALLGGAAVNAATGPLTERWGTSRSLTFCLALWGLLLPLGGALEMPVAFAVVLVGVVGIGGAVDVVMNIASSAAFAQQPGRLVRINGVFNAGAVAGAVGTELLLELDLSWRWIWLANGLIALALAYGCRRVDLPAGEVGDDHGMLESLRTVHRQGFLLVAIAFATGAAVEGGIDVWGVLYLRETLASGLLVGAAAYIAGQFVATSARFTLGPAAGSLGASRGVALGAGLAAGGLALMAVASSAALGALGLVAAAAGISVSWPLLIAHVSAGTDRPALIVGGVTSVGYLGFVLGPVIVGWVADTLGLRAGLAFLAAAAVFVAVTPSRGGGHRA